MNGGLTWTVVLGGRAKIRAGQHSQSEDGILEATPVASELGSPPGQGLLADLLDVTGGRLLKAHVACCWSVHSRERFLEG